MPKVAHLLRTKNSRIWNTGSYKECSKRKYLNVHKTLWKLFSIRISRDYKEFQIIISRYLATGRDLDLVVPRRTSRGGSTVRGPDDPLRDPLGARIRSIKYKWINKNLNGLSELTLKLNLLILKSCSLSNKCFWARSEFFEHRSRSRVLEIWPKSETTEAPWGW